MSAANFYWKTSRGCPVVFRLQAIFSSPTFLKVPPMARQVVLSWLALTRISFRISSQGVSSSRSISWKVSESAEVPALLLVLKKTTASRSPWRTRESWILMLTIWSSVRPSYLIRRHRLSRHSCEEPSFTDR